MKALKVLGTEKIGKIEFTGIEGGFGKDKKAMLAKDVALIHGRSLREINEVITRNITDKYVEYTKIKTEIREELGKYLYNETECKPMIIAVIQEV